MRQHETYCFALGFLEEDEHDNDLDDDPSFVEEVEFPAAGFDAEWVDVLREEEREVRSEGLKHETVCTDVER